MLQRLSARVRPANPADAAAWLAMRHTLWPEGSIEEHREEIGKFFADKPGEPLAVLIAEDVEGRTIGFAELSIRACAEGCRTNRIGYLEGWYVVPEARRRGVGRLLVEGAEQWARAQGCVEFASDSVEANSVSARAHRALGFTDVGLIRCYRKDL